MRPKTTNAIAAVRLTPLLVLVLTVSAVGSGEEAGSEAEAPSRGQANSGEAGSDSKESKSGSRIDRWIAALDHPEYEEREAATTELMQSEALSEKRLTRALRSPSSPEQRHRLLRVAMHHYYRDLSVSGMEAPAGHRQGALGIHTPSESIVRPGDHPKLEHPAMMVTKIYPGFPAFVHLRPRDLIFGIAGEPFGSSFSQRRFSELIKEHSSGERVSLMVLRDGKRIEVPVRLASKPRLELIDDRLSMANKNPKLYPSWLRHRQELLGSDGGPRVVEIPAPESTEDQRAANSDDEMSD